MPPILLLFDEGSAALRINVVEELTIVDSFFGLLAKTGLVVRAIDRIRVDDGAALVPLIVTGEEIRILVYVNGPNGAERWCTGGSVVVIPEVNDPNYSWLKGQYLKRVLTSPSVTLTWSDVLFGIVLAEVGQVELDNTDGVLSGWVTADYRGSTIRIVRYDVTNGTYVIEIDGEIVFTDPAENILIEVASIQLDVLQKQIPDTFVTLEEFPSAWPDEIGASIPEYYGYHERVPCRYVGIYRETIPSTKLTDPTDTPAVFDYLVARGNVGVQSVYAGGNLRSPRAVSAVVSGQGNPLPFDAAATVIVEAGQATPLWWGIAQIFRTKTGGAQYIRTIKTAAVVASSIVLSSINAVTAGHTIFVSVHRDSLLTPTSVMDSKGNTYVLIQEIVANGDSFAVWAAFNVIGLAPSDTITVTCPDSSATGVAAYDYDGITSQDTTVPVASSGIGSDASLPPMTPSAVPSMAIMFLYVIAVYGPPSAGVGLTDKAFDLTINAGASPAFRRALALFDGPVTLEGGFEAQSQYVVSTIIYPGYTVIRFFEEQVDGDNRPYSITADIEAFYPKHEQTTDYANGFPIIRGEWKFNGNLRDTGKPPTGSALDGHRPLTGTGIQDGDFTAGMIGIGKSALLFSRVGQSVAIPFSSGFFQSARFVFRIVVRINSVMRGIPFILVLGPDSNFNVGTHAVTNGWILKHVAAGSCLFQWQIKMPSGTFTLQATELAYDEFNDLSLVMYQHTNGHYFALLVANGQVIDRQDLGTSFVDYSAGVDMQVPPLTGTPGYVLGAIDYMYFKDITAVTETAVENASIREYRMLKRNGITFLRQFFERLNITNYALGTAEDDWDDINNGIGLPIEISLLESQSVKDVFDAVLRIRGGRITKGWTVEIDTPRDTLIATNFQFVRDETDTLRSGRKKLSDLRPRVRANLGDMVKSIKVRYRPVRDPESGEIVIYQFHQTLPVLSRGKEEVLDMPQLYDHLGAAVFLQYYVRKLIAADNRAAALVDERAGRYIVPGQLIKISATRFGITDQYYQVARMERAIDSHRVDLFQYNPTVYDAPVNPALPGPTPTDVLGVPVISGWFPYVRGEQISDTSYQATIRLVQRILLMPTSDVLAEFATIVPASPTTHFPKVADELNTTYVLSAAGATEQRELYGVTPQGQGSGDIGPVVAVFITNKIGVTGAATMRVLAQLGVAGALGRYGLFQSTLGNDINAHPVAIYHTITEDPDGLPWDFVTINTLRIGLSVVSPASNVKLAKTRAYAYHQTLNRLPADFDALLLFRSPPLTSVSLITDADGNLVMSPTFEATYKPSQLSAPYKISHTLTIEDTEFPQTGRSYLYWLAIRDRSGLVSPLTSAGFVVVPLLT